ncbi:uncharacterized protein PHACADRAFT_257118 [Phanerochaete carnosa HHB-10118-sp]|uniref:Protein kinase domain-containing protein n=1 Tax=Phanerochaete carnosa (strain HHB-10118-sp) TaxID=650164 RepID=K5VWX5_PHACS|nr:uncharacterized protein PHACADRAFT_257118 [Phanerochaete carnosa HHB-10118-sp]EKM56068.1 hypothetical protein PHACADRAFT_257118 [Phanerochaete carnosa HHB-10118-sp]
MLENWNFHGSHSHFASSASGSSLGGQSHLSILSSPSSMSSSLSDVHPPSQAPSPSPSFSSGRKTNAFFASPFSDLSSPEPVPPPPLARSSSFVSSSSQPSTRERPDDDNDSTPRLSSAAPPKVAGSLMDTFFRPASFDSHPTPPPSIHSLGSAPTSPEASPPSSPRSGAKHRQPPLSRIFPSRARYTAVDALPSRQTSLRTHSPLPDAHAFPPNIQSSGRRHFVDLEEEPVISTSPERMSAPPQPPVPEPEEKPRPKALNVLILPSAGESSLPTPVSIAQATPPPSGPPPPLKLGDIITEIFASNVDSHDAGVPDGTLKLELLRTLGQGAFSSVWLARDVSGRIGGLEVVRKSSLRRSLSKSSARSSGSIRRKTRSLRKKLEGAAPQVHFDNGGRFGHGERLGSEDSQSGWFKEGEHRGRSEGEQGRLVALKMTDRTLCDKDDRTRVSFIREVEVLKHISHPSIVSYIHAFSTPAYHVLVLEHILGGELFDLVSTPELHAQLDEPLLRRIFGELCRAVSWMHAVGLVHRDIKLENIMLTRPAFSDPSNASALIKLTDFGLSRFIDPATPLLTTRCGSESYAAPELVTGRPYDGRDTDAWACGVVLYALATRRLPFDSADTTRDDNMRHEERAALPGGEQRRVRGPRRDERAERKALLMRIANGEYSWPETSPMTTEPLRGTALAQSEGMRRVVGRLLVRNPQKRTRLAQLWGDEWLHGEGAPPVPSLPDSMSPSTEVTPVHDNVSVISDDTVSEASPDIIDPEEEFLDEDEDAADGVLVDEQDIGPDSVARQEH